MSTLQVGNLHFESTGNNRLQYTGSNAYNLVAGGTTVATVNTSAVDIPLNLTTNTVTANTISVKTLSANGSNGTAGQSLISGGVGNSYWATTGQSTVVMTAFTANGTWTPANSSLKSIKVTLVSGGGSGGLTGSNYTSPPGTVYSGGAGGGGGSGAVAINAFPTLANPSILSPVTVTVGTAGGNTTPTYAAGGTSSFGSLLSATGGARGANGTNASPPGTSGSGGSGGATGAATGGLALTFSTAGSSGTPGSSGSSSGEAGTNMFVVNGKGSSGGLLNPATTRAASGFIIIEEYY
jgi:hypothetical protein